MLHQRDVEEEEEGCAGLQFNKNNSSRVIGAIWYEY